MRHQNFSMAGRKVKNPVEEIWHYETDEIKPICGVRSKRTTRNPACVTCKECKKKIDGVEYTPPRLTEKIPCQGYIPVKKIKWVCNQCEDLEEPCLHQCERKEWLPTSCTRMAVCSIIKVKCEWKEKER